MKCLCLAIAFCFLSIAGCSKGAASHRQTRDEAAAKAKEEFSKFAKQHNARSDWKQLSKSMAIHRESNLTLHTQNAIEQLEGQAIAIPLQVVDVFRKGDEYFIVGTDFADAVYKLRCTKALADIAATQPEPHPVLTTLAVICNLNGASSAYGRDYTANAPSVVEEGDSIEIDISELTPRMVVSGDCSAVQSIDASTFLFALEDELREAEE